MSETQIYNSTTHGPIPLSFTGRRLLANLREAITDAIELGDYSTNGTNAVARARGDIAARLSNLEQRLPPAREQPLVDEIQKLKEALRATRDQRDAALAKAELEMKRKECWIGVANTLGEKIDKVKEFLK